MVCIAISNILKGYFYGTSKITVPAIIDIFEKAMRILTVSLLIFLTKAQTLESMVTLATVALCIGEFQSLFFLYIYYKYSIKKMPLSKERTESRVQLLFDVIVIALPLCLNGFLTNILGTLSTLIVPRRLLAAGFNYPTALSMIGKYTGMALSVIMIPLIIVTTINTLLIPDLSQSLVLGKQYEASVRIKKVLKVAFLLGIATSIICNVIPNSLGEMFYSRSDLGQYIRFASLTSPIFFPAITMFGILNGLNRQGIILRNSLIEAIIELICLFIFTGIPSINIFGYSITMLIACTIGFILNLHEVKKHINLNLNKSNIIIYLMLGFLTFLIINIFSKHIYTHSLIINNFIIMGLVFSIFVYLGTFGENE
jgi:stage V sporulation protein B